MIYVTSKLHDLTITSKGTKGTPDGFHTEQTARDLADAWKFFGHSDVQIVNDPTIQPEQPWDQVSARVSK